MKTLLHVVAASLFFLPTLLVSAQDQGQQQNQGQENGEKPPEQQPVVLVIPLTIQVAPQPTETQGKAQPRTTPQRPPYVPRDPNSQPTSAAPRVHPDPGPVTREEYLKKKALYDAKVAEQERIKQEYLKQRQEALAQGKEREANGQTLEDEVKLSIRENLPPKPIDPELLRRMEIWHRAYSQQVQTFKTDLGRFLAEHNSPTVTNRRVACTRLFSSSSALLAGKALVAPDPELAKLSQSMVDKFRLAAGACVENETDAVASYVQQGEQALVNLAAGLAPYKMAP